MIKSIFSTVYMLHVIEEVRKKYENLNLGEKKDFLERIQKRRLRKYVCDDCPENKIKGINLCSLCNIIYHNFNNVKLGNEINLLTEKNAR